MKGPLNKIIVGSMFFLSTCGVAVVGYYLAGWNLVDAIYMVVITIFGVGYGEVRPVTEPSLKVFTMAVIIIGCSSLIYITGGFIQMITEGEINRALGTRRKTKGIDKLSRHAIICGFGRVGRILAAELHQAKHDFVVVDSNPERVRDVEMLSYLVVCGNATEEETLRSAGIERARVLATVLPDDASNVFITLTARELSAAIEIIGRAEHPETERKLRRSGANEVVLPSAIGAGRICQLITNPDAGSVLGHASAQFEEDLRHIGLQMREIELPEDSPLVQRPLAECEMAASNNFLLAALIRPSGEMIHNPGLDILLQPGDKIVVIASAQDMSQIVKRSSGRASMLYRGVRH